MPLPHSYTRSTYARASTEMVVAAFAFATMGCIAHGFRDSVSWPLVAFARILVTAILAWMMIARYGAPILVRGTPALWARSLFGAMGLLSTFYCLTHLPITDTVTIFATSPIWIAIILTVFFRERLSRSVWVYAALALAGVYVMERPAFDAESAPLFVALLGSVVVSLAKISLGRCGALPPASVVAHYSTVASLVSLGVWLALAFRLPAMTAEPGPFLWLWLFPMGLAGTVGQYYMTLAYGRGSTTLVALVGISQIGFSLGYDVLVYSHAFDVLHVAGIGMIATAIALTIVSEGRRLRVVDEPSTAGRTEKAA